MIEIDLDIPILHRDNFDILVANSLFNQKAITLQDIKKRKQEIAEIADTIYKSKWKKGFLNALFNKISTEFSVNLDENIFPYRLETYPEQEIIDKISKLYIDVSLLKIE